jgi:hypothetical protein
MITSSVSYHGESFSWSCLAISKYANIKTIKNRPNEWLHISEDFPWTRENIADHILNYSNVVDNGNWKENKPWAADGPNTLLKLKDLRPFTFFDGTLIVITPSSMFSTVLKWFGWPDKKGLTRQYTLILPNQRKLPALILFWHYVLTKAQIE